ncbi:MAG: sulfatase-like hydrolase/transferase [Fuerstiella sp.]|nr:sulfatase-like hydrolase/transferase [Fuerstiella sp.]MCP4858185.1 sulfatase-like hydrolase/transferase [Fuerstiella sp.]
MEIRILSKLPVLLCLACCCVGLLFSRTCIAAEVKKTDRPNILIFMADDIGSGDIHALNPQKRESITPNIDELIKAGVSFHHAHSPAAVCAPTRYALLTGNHVYRGRLANGTWSPDLPSQILKGQETLGNRLQENGYHTAFFGKVHLGGIFRNADGEVVQSFSEADLSKKFNDGVSEHGFDYSRFLTAPLKQSHGPVRKLLAVQAPNLADSATASRRKRMGWSFYSYDHNGKILNAVMSKSKYSRDFKNTTVDELYLLTDDEDQSQDIRSSNQDLMNSLKQKLTIFLRKDATHSGQLATPEKATNWRNIVASE